MRDIQAFDIYNLVHTPDFRINNFDLLRFLAALQVLISHTLGHLKIPLPAWYDLLEKFQGVPIFFVISGFLISASYERNPNVKSYVRNRALRIFPALWICLIIAIATAAVFGGINFMKKETIPWVLGQISFVQFFNPEFLRNYGVGVLNGSLWTIPVELQFYIVLPFLYWVLTRYKIKNSGWYILLLLSALTNYITAHLKLPHLWNMMVNVTLLPHLYMFLLGVILQRWEVYKYSIISGKGFLWIAVYVAFLYTTNEFTGKFYVANILLALSIISLAYSSPRLAQKLLRGNDISYGVYLYHMVFVNIFVELAIMGRYLYLLEIAALTFPVAYLSWIFIERPCLLFKKRTIKLIQ